MGKNRRTKTVLQKQKRDRQGQMKPSGKLCGKQNLSIKNARLNKEKGQSISHTCLRPCGQQLGEVRGKEKMNLKGQGNNSANIISPMVKEIRNCNPGVSCNVPTS